jgi:hypothetical protein
MAPAAHRGERAQAEGWPTPHRAIGHVDKTKGPLLIIQGATDPRVPVGEALQMFEVMQKKKLGAELIVFPDPPNAMLAGAHGSGLLLRANQETYQHSRRRANLFCCLNDKLAPLERRGWEPHIRRLVPRQFGSGTPQFGCERRVKAGIDELTAGIASVDAAKRDGERSCHGHCRYGSSGARKINQRHGTNSDGDEAPKPAQTLARGAVRADLTDQGKIVVVEGSEFGFERP